MVAIAVLLVVGCSTGRAALAFSPDSLQDASIGQPYDAIISVLHNETPVGDIYVSKAALPPGVTLTFTAGSSSSADLTGTSTTAGSYVFTVSAWCLGTNVNGQAGEKSYSLVVN